MTMAPTMQLAGPAEQPLTNELAVIAELVPMQGVRLLELGCGGAEKTRQIAETMAVTEIVAAEVDQVAHRRNLAVTDLPQVRFRSFGAEAIAEPDNSFDVVMMFKSLHHVPLAHLDTALAEIARVLRPGGLAYISEPVFAGAFNEVMRVFHDEEVVRQAAFDALVRAVSSGLFVLEHQRFFRNQVRFASWDQYERGILNVTHTEHNLSPAQLAEVKRRFCEHESDAGYVFEIPNRVDLLRKPGD
ncbi:MAG: class I SAM-dependent methyltransferase [Pseudomonadota bacterium]